MTAFRSAPLVIAHRGLVGPRAPENSLPAVRLALAAGCDGVEVDVRRTADGALVLMHDPTPARTAIAGDDDNGQADPRREVEETDLDSLQALRLLTQDDGAEVRVPELADVLEEVLARNAVVVLDVKATGPGARVWRALAEELLDRVPPELRRLVVVQGRDQAALQEVAARVPGVLTSLLTWAPVADAAGTWAVSRPDWSARVLLTRDHLQARRVLAWTVNRPERMRRLVADGADGIITDRPTVLLALLDRGPATVAS
ncbi:MAG: glycerophosphodiester phosphodiesterase family protein [Nocardioidaceae bacterium]